MRRRISLATLALLTSVGIVTGMAQPASAIGGDVDLTVRVTNPSGSPITGITVIAVPMVGGHYDDVAPEVEGESAGSGRYVVEGLDSGRDYTLFFDAPASKAFDQFWGGSSDLLGAVSRSWSAGAHQLHVSLETGTGILGSVSKSGGPGLAGMEVIAYQLLQGEWYEAARTTTSSVGAYKLTNLETGSYRLHFGPKSGTQSKYAGEFSGNVYDFNEALAVEVKTGGMSPVNAVLSTGGTLSGLANSAPMGMAMHPNSYAKIEAYRLNEDGEGGFTVDDSHVYTDASADFMTNRYRVTGLPPGFYIAKVLEGAMFRNDSLQETWFNGTGGSRDVSYADVFEVKLGATTQMPTLNQEALVGPSNFVHFEDADGAPVTTWKAWFYSVSSYRPVTYQEKTDWSFASIWSAPGTYRVVALGWRDGVALAPIDEVFYHGAGWLGSWSDDNHYFTFEDAADFAIDAFGVDGEELSLGSSFTAHASTTFDDDDVDYGYQWYRDGLPIFGARSASYATRGVDVGSELSVRVVATTFGYPAQHETEVIGVITPGVQPVAVAPPTIATTGVLPGTVLRAEPGEWSVAQPAFGYRWLRDGAPIPDATGREYRVAPADAGHDLAVEVTATKLGHPDSEPSTSAASEVEFLAAPTLITPVKVTATTTGVSAGSVRYRATSGTWNVSGTLTDFAWFADGTAIPGATSSSLDLVTAGEFAGASITVRVTAHKLGYLDGTGVAVARKGTGAVSVLTPSAIVNRTEGDAVVDGSAQPEVGQKLAATSPTLEYPDGDGGVLTRSYRWERSSDGVAWKTIIDAVASTYTVTSSDVGRHLRVTVTTKSNRYSAVTPSSSGASGSVVLRQALVESATPTISIAGSHLVTAAHRVDVSGAWGVTGATLSYTWFNCDETCSGEPGTDPSSWVAIPGATKSTFTPSLGLAGQSLIVRVQASKSGYAPTSRYSAPIALEPLAPLVPSVKPSVSVSGNVFTASPGSWNPVDVAVSYEWRADGVAISSSPSVEVPAGSAVTVEVRVEHEGYASKTFELIARKGAAPTAPSGAIVGSSFGDALVAPVTPWAFPAPLAGSVTYKYQWYAGSTAISGATSSEYRPPATNVGKAIRVKVTASSPYFATPSAYSTPSITLLKAPAPIGSPVIAAAGGVVAPGAKLTVDRAGYSVSGLTYAYTWEARAGSGAWAKVSTSSSITLKTSDVGKEVRVTVVGKKPGYETSTIMTPAVPVVFLAPFVATSDPSLSTAQVGTPVKVATTWSTSVTLSYQWFLNDVAVPGATGASFTPAAGALNAELHAVVTASKPGHVSVSIATAPRVIGLGSSPVASKAPTVAGSLTVGSTLSAAPGAWNVGGLEFDYEWSVDDTVVGSGPTFVVPTGATAVTLRVVASRPGYLNGEASKTFAIAP